MLSIHHATIFSFTQDINLNNFSKLLFEKLFHIFSQSKMFANKFQNLVEKFKKIFNVKNGSKQNVHVMICKKSRF